MNFHSYCKCELRNMTEPVAGATERYDIMSNNEYVGCLKFCSVTEEWILSLTTHHIGVTHEFLAKVWACLLNKLQDEEHSCQCNKCTCGRLMR